MFTQFIAERKQVRVSAEMIRSEIPFENTFPKVDVTWNELTVVELAVVKVEIKQVLFCKT